MLELFLCELLIRDEVSVPARDAPMFELDAVGVS